jgi:hypothetical protein
MADTDVTGAAEKPTHFSGLVVVVNAGVPWLHFQLTDSTQAGLASDESCEFVVLESVITEPSLGGGVAGFRSSPCRP